MGIQDAAGTIVLGQNFYYYGFLIALGAVAYLLCLFPMAKAKGFKGQLTLFFGGWLLPISWFFARVFYVLIRIGYFTNTINRPSAMLAFWDGGYSLIGALAGGIIAAFCFAKVNKVSFAKWIDVAVAPLGLFLAIARFGEIFTLNIGRGKAVESHSWVAENSFLAINDFATTPGASPSLAVFRFEGIVGLLLLALGIMLLFSKKSIFKKDGDRALLWASTFGVFQVLLESLRDDGHLLWGFVRISQVLCMFLPMIALGIFTKRMIKKSQGKKESIIAWAIALVGLGVGIYQEFQIDVTANIFKEYVIMACALATILWAVGWLWLKSAKGEDLAKA